MKFFTSVFVIGVYPFAGIAGAQGAAHVRLPAGISIPVRTVDRIASEGAASALEYRATVDDSVMSGTATLVPLGTPAFLRVVQVQQAGAVRGHAGVTVRLVALEVDGQRIEFDTGDAKIEGSSQAKKAAKAGILAGLMGAAVGAAAGGAKGAVEGAAIGGAAGVAAAAISGQRVQVPAETRLSFTLTGSSTTAAAAAVDPALLAELLALERKGSAAAIAGDRDGVEALLDSSFVGTINGRTVSRAGYLKLVKPQPSIVSGDIESPQLRTDSEGASVSGYYVIQVRARKQIRTVRQKFRDTFVQRDGKWLVRSTEVVSQ